MHYVGGQRGGRQASFSGVGFHGGIGFLRFSHPRLVSVLFPAPSLLEMKFFFRNFSPLVSALFGGFLNQFSNTTRFTSEYDDITLQTNVSSLATR